LKLIGYIMLCAGFLFLTVGMIRYLAGPSTYFSTYDFSSPFLGLEVSAIGLLCIVITAFFGNPLGRFLEFLFVKFRLLLGARSIEDLKETEYRARTNARFILYGLGISILIWLIAVAWALSKINSFVEEYKIAAAFAGMEEYDMALRSANVVYDHTIRFLLFFVPMILLPFAVVFIIYLIGDTGDILVRRWIKLDPKSEFNFLHQKNHLGTWLYKDSILALVVATFSIFLAFLQPHPVRTVLLFLAASILSLAIGRNIYLSYDITCRQLNLNVVREFRTSRIVSSFCITSGIWQVFLLITLWRWTYSVLLPPVAEFLMKTDYLTKTDNIPKRLIDILHNMPLKTISGVLDSLSVLNSDYLIFIIWLFAFWGIIYIYLMPNLFSVSLRRKLIRKVISAIIVFAFSFISQILLSRLVPQYMSGNILLLATTSAVIAVTMKFMEKTYEGVMDSRTREKGTQ